MIQGMGVLSSINSVNVNFFLAKMVKSIWHELPPVLSLLTSFIFKISYFILDTENKIIACSFFFFEF